MGTGSLSQWYSGQGKELTTHPQSSIEVKNNSTAILLLHLWAFMTCYIANFPFTILVNMINRYIAKSMLIIQDAIQ